MGTKNKSKIYIKNKKNRRSVNLFLSCTEITISKINEIKTKVKCFMKKKYVCLFIFSATIEDVEENEKKSPNKKRNTNKKNICLSIFLHHFANKPVFSLPKLNIYIFSKFF